MKILTNKIYLSVTGIILLIAVSVFFFKTNYSDTEYLVNKIFIGFQDKDWRMRDAAAAKLSHNEKLLKNKKVQQQLINVFRDEVEVRKHRNYPITEQSESDGDAYGEYYIELLVLAGKLKNQDAIPFLVNSLEFGRGVAESLIGFGDTALPLLLDKCKNGSEDERWWCFITLPEFYKQTKFYQLKSEIKTILENASQENNGRISKKAAEVLGKLE